MVTVNGITYQNGTKTPGKVVVTKKMDGTEQIIPYTVVAGAQDGPTLLLDGCIHGDEPDGSMAIIRVMNALDPAKMKGNVIAVPAVNVDALANAKRGNPRDEMSYDLNRIYPGKAIGFPTERVAWAHFENILKCCDAEISCHGGGDHSNMMPAIFETGIEDGSSLELAKMMGEDWPLINCHLGHASPDGQMKLLGKPGITVEIGGRSATIPEIFDATIKTLEKGFYNVMMCMGIIDESPYGEKTRRNWWYRAHQETVYVENCGIINPIYGDKVGKPMLKGDPLVQVVNLYGEVVQEAVAPCNGVPFGVHSNPSVTTGEWMCFFGQVDKVSEEVCQDGKLVEVDYTFEDWMKKNPELYKGVVERL